MEESVVFLPTVIQQFVNRHLHITRPLGKHFDKEYVVDTKEHLPSHMIWFVVSYRGSVNESKYVELLIEADTAQAPLPLHDLHERSRTLSPIKDNH